MILDSLETTTLIKLLRQMAHDMRVPLNTLISTSDMLVQGTYDPLTPKQDKALTRIQRNNYRLLAILDDFMTYVKVANGEMVLNFESFDPRAKLEAWCDPVRVASEERGLAFHLTTIEAVPAMITGDETALQRIVQAVLWNAVAFTAKGEIRVLSDWGANQTWSISIKDSGSGISTDDLPHIFEPFWRGEERPQVPTAGAGLGLPMALALTKLMRGNLFITDSSHNGSNFCIQIPL